MSDGGDFVGLVSKFQLHLRLTLFVQHHLFILPCLVCLNALVKYILCVTAGYVASLVPKLLFLHTNQQFTEK